MARRTLRDNVEIAFAFSVPVAWYCGLFAVLGFGAAPSFAITETYDAPERIVMLEQTFELSAVLDAEPVEVPVEPVAEPPAEDDAAAEPVAAADTDTPAPAAPTAPVEPGPAELAAAPVSANTSGIPEVRTRNGEVMRTPPKRPTSKKRKKVDCDTDDGIVQMSTEEYAVPRSLVDFYTGNLGEAARLAYVSWHRDGAGDVDGFKVRRMNCANVLRQAGLNNGDVIHKINGRKVTSIPQALKAYTRLRNNRTLKLELTRKDGTRLNLRYKLS